MQQDNSRYKPFKNNAKNISQYIHYKHLVTKIIKPNRTVTSLSPIKKVK